MEKIDNDWDLLSLRSCELHTSLAEITDENQAHKLICDFLRVNQKNSSLIVPDFDKNLEWLNTSRPLSFSGDLRGKVVVLDFFTYCCINCLHVLPALRSLEARFSGRPFAVIGVHSAKFDNERVSAHILSAVRRYDIRHPVVNDCDAALWGAMRVACWPTLVVVGPGGEVLLSLAGENHGATVERFVAAALQFYERDVVDGMDAPDGESLDAVDAAAPALSLSPALSPSLSPALSPSSPAPSLLFPGKLSVDATGQRLAISDTGHHRVIVLSTTTACVQFCIGGDEEGFLDGDFRTARFRAPQGLCWHNEGRVIYLADTGNHVIRKIDLQRQLVETVAGSGDQGSDYEGGLTGTAQSISSPWDVVIGRTTHSSEDVLFIAMAGLHQIWVLFLQDTTWLKGREERRGTCVRFVGSGREENRNTSYPHQAGLAQPSGLVFAVEDGSPVLYVADSESSTVRSVSLVDGAVKGLVGGERDPTDLFAFGDADGVGIAAKLQHPLGIAHLQPGTLLVADSYNHKVKLVDVKTKSCSTLLGDKVASGDGGYTAHAQLNEPSGLCVHPDGGLVYIADTNNHAIKTFDLKTRSISEMKVNFDEASASFEKPKSDLSMKKRRLASSTAKVMRLTPLVTSGGSDVQLLLSVKFSEVQHITEEAPSSWQIVQTDESCQLVSCDQLWSGTLDSGTHTIRLHVPADWSDLKVEVKVECLLYYCDDDSGACHMKTFLLEQPIHVVAGASQQTSHALVLNLADLDY